MFKFGFAILICYLAAYGVLRQTQQEVWADDGQTYVVFPASAPIFYYGVRPITLLDAALTGMRFHIGPHL